MVMPAYSEITKDILTGLYETGKVMLTGNSKVLGIKNWRAETAWDITKGEREDRKKFSQALWRLKKSRLIILKQKGEGKFVVELTEKGRRRIKEFQLADLEIPIPNKWDGRLMWKC